MHRRAYAIWLERMGMPLKLGASVPVELHQPMADVLIGGNHLAIMLLGQLTDIPPYTLPITACALRGDTLDVWIAWRAIMQLRDAMQELGLYE